MLEELISIDIIRLINHSSNLSIEKVNLFKEEAIRNFDRISKLGTELSNELTLETNPNTLQDSTYIKALKIFNERNYYVVNCLSKNKSLEKDENLIKSQEKLSVFKKVSLALPNFDIESNEPKKLFQIDETVEGKPKLEIQPKYLDRFIKSLSVHTIDSNSKDNLIKLLQGQSISEPIKFSCPANSVITFFKEMNESGILLNSKTVSGKFIQSNFLFKWRSNFSYPKESNIKNFLTRSEPPSKVTQKIFLVE